MQPLAKPRAILTVAALALALAASLAFAAVDGPLAQYAYDQPGDKKFICNTGILERESPTASNNQSFRIASPRASSKPPSPTNPSPSRLPITPSGTPPPHIPSPTNLTPT